jgi:hypothetical protein
MGDHVELKTDEDNASEFHESFGSPAHRKWVAPRFRSIHTDTVREIGRKLILAAKKNHRPDFCFIHFGGHGFLHCSKING